MKLEEGKKIGSKELNVAEFDVSKVWKGSKEAHMTVVTPSSDAACGVKFQVGSEYLVYSSSAGGVKLCGGTKEVGIAHEDLEYLKKPKP
jgi:hypothetical protein